MNIATAAEASRRESTAYAELSRVMKIFHELVVTAKNPPNRQQNEHLYVWQMHGFPFRPLRRRQKGDHLVRRIGVSRNHEVMLAPAKGSPVRVPPSVGCS